MSTPSEHNRREFPETAKMIDEFRRVFGPVKVRWAVENGKVIGNIPPDAESLVAHLLERK